MIEPDAVFARRVEARFVGQDHPFAQWHDAGRVPEVMGVAFVRESTLGDGLDVVIHAPDEALDAMIPVVTDMHTRSGLIEEVRASAVDLPTAEEMVLDYIRGHVKQAKMAPLAGNSIATDRGFIARDMARLDEYLHYRMIDVSSIKELCRRWYPRIYFGQPEKGLAHRALADIHESIRELKYYRQTVFVAPPGPSTSEIAAIAAELGQPAKDATGTDSAPGHPTG